MKNINTDIKNKSFKKIYFLYGEEDYLKSQIKKNLSKAICEDDMMNLTTFDMNANIEEIYQVSQNLPFFSDRRLIILENVDILNRASEELINVFNNMPEYLHFIILEKSVDKRKKLYKIIKEKGYLCELNFQTYETLFKFIQQRFNDLNKKISNEAIEYIIKSSLNNLYIINNEIEKLYFFTLDKEKISLSDATLISSVNFEDKIFDMIDAIANKNPQIVFKSYYDLVALKVPYVKMFILLEKAFSNIYLIKKLSKTMSKIEIEKFLNDDEIKKFKISTYLRCSKFFREDTLLKFLEDFSLYEQEIKTGLLIDRIGFELILSKILQNSD